VAMSSRVRSGPVVAHDAHQILGRGDRNAVGSGHSTTVREIAVPANNGTSPTAALVLRNALDSWHSGWRLIPAMGLKTN
jgi:hypothetical protein